MAKESGRVRDANNTENRRINTESDQFMNLIRGRMNNPNATAGYDNILNRNRGNWDAAFRGMANGGLTDENKRRIRGNGGFDEAAQTGLYSEGDKTNIRSHQ